MTDHQNQVKPVQKNETPQLNTAEPTVFESKSIQNNPLNPKTILHLQRTIGNKKVQRLVAGQRSEDGINPNNHNFGLTQPSRIMADDKPSDHVLEDQANTSQQSDMEIFPSSGVEASLLTRGISQVQRKPGAGKDLPPVAEIQRIRQLIQTHQNDLETFLEAAKKDIENLRAYFKWVDGVYKRTYGHFELVLKQANAQIDSQQAWIDFVVGVGTGIAVGLCFEVTLAAGAAKMGIELLSEVAAEAVEGGMGAGLKAGKVTDIPKAEFLDELQPAMKQVIGLLQLDKLNETVLNMAVPGTFVYTNPLIMAERLSAEAYLIATGGVRQRSDDEVRAGYQKLKKFEAQSTAAQPKLLEAKEKFAKLRQAYTGKQAPSDQQCEQDIWIPWIAKQDPRGGSFTSSILSNKIIANHLVDIGLAGRGTRGGRLNADSIDLQKREVKDPITGEPRGLSTENETPATQMQKGATAQLPIVKNTWKDIFFM